MKLFGKAVEGPNVEVIVIPRGEQSLVFKAQAVLDFDTFNKMVPVPLAPMILYKGSTVASPNVEDPEYKKAISSRANLQSSWMIIKSLEATPGLEWELIKAEDPSTWDKFFDEFKRSGFTEVEIGRILQGVMTANGLNEEKMEQARKRFLEQEAQARPTG